MVRGEGLWGEDALVNGRGSGFCVAKLFKML